jgi:hypothetical protein
MNSQGGNNSTRNRNDLHYKSYNDMKADKNALKLIGNFRYTKVDHESKVNRYLEKSPFQEFIDESYRDMLQYPEENDKN